MTGPTLQIFDHVVGSHISGGGGRAPHEAHLIREAVNNWRQLGRNTRDHIFGIQTRVAGVADRNYLLIRNCALAGAVDGDSSAAVADRRDLAVERISL